ncbi:MAG: MFS transporter, partial [Marinilabiliales bacterium]
SAFINYAATFAISFMLSLFLQYVIGIEATQAGMILVIQPVVMAIVASFSGRLSDRKNPRKLAALGMGSSAVGLLLLSFINQDTSTSYILLALFILGFGFGMFSSPNTNVIMGSVDRKVYGTASAMVATMRNTGMMFSMAIASLTIHWFLGKAQISIENTELFVASTRVVFTIFTVLCSIGVYTSLVRSRK